MFDLVPKKMSKNSKKLRLASASILHLLSDLSPQLSPLVSSSSEFFASSPILLVKFVCVELADSSGRRGLVVDSG